MKKKYCLYFLLLYLIKILMMYFNFYLLTIYISIIFVIIKQDLVIKSNYFRKINNYINI